MCLQPRYVDHIILGGLRQYFTVNQRMVQLRGGKRLQREMGGKVREMGGKLGRWLAS
jgi:hypothetical protein